MRVGLNTKPSAQSESVAQYDTVVVGAGPYGLSTAAHLLWRGQTVGVFGKTLEFWRKRMPKGMLLRSHWWATNLSDPRKQYRFDRFLSNSKYEKRYPVPAEAFIDYALWFKERAVPGVDETYVSSIERQRDQFLLTLEDGRKVQSAAVVMATGLHYHAYRPECYTHLPAELVSHSCEHNDLGCFKGKQVVIIGGGQSAIEYAALLHEVGTTVHVVSRRPISWLAADRLDERTVLARILAPNTGLAPGWKNWIEVHLPDVFYHLPQGRKDRHYGSYRSGATHWLRERVIGKVVLHENQRVITMEEVNRNVDLTISDGQRVRADHVLLATGYKVDMNKLTVIHPSLLAETKTDMGFPILSRWFESSVPGFYIVGFTAVRAFGAAHRFVVGCEVAARRVAKSVALRRTRQRQSVQIKMIRQPDSSESK